MNNIDFEQLAKALINSFIEIYGIKDTLRELLYDGINKEQLIKLGFLEEDIDIAIKKYLHYDFDNLDE